MLKTQEPKYNAYVFDANGDMQALEPDYELRIVNRVSGEPIPDDEPIFILRARDIHALDTLADYHDRCDDIGHSQAVVSRIRNFEDFKKQHPERMKEPDTDESWADEW